MKSLFDSINEQIRLLRATWVLIFPTWLLCFSAVDIISAIEFDKSGDHLATGDRGGRVVLFERTDTKDVCLLECLLCYLLPPHMFLASCVC